MFKQFIYSFLFLSFTLISSGCANQITPTTVKVPVAIASPAPIIPPRPDLPIAHLKPNSPPNVVIKAYAESIEILQNYALQLRTLLSAYTNKRD